MKIQSTTLHKTCLKWLYLREKVSSITTYYAIVYSVSTHCNKQMASIVFFYFFLSTRCCSTCFAIALY